MSGYNKHLDWVREINSKKELAYWVNLALDFNKEAKASKKQPVKKKK